MSEQLYARLKGQGPTAIVLLHGFGGHHGEWIDIQPELARDALVIAYDLPGHGRSMDSPGAGAAGVAARAILADLAQRGHQRVHVAGFSMGGAIATLMAMRAPDRIASLTLLAPGGYGPEISETLLRSFAEATDADALRRSMDEMSAAGFRTPTRNVAGLAAVRFVPGQRARMLEIVAAIAKDGKQGEIPPDAIAALRMPVSVMWGTADPVLPFAQSAGLPAHFALEVIDGAGHMLPVEALKGVTVLIRRTVRQAEAALSAKL